MLKRIYRLPVSTRLNLARTYSDPLFVLKIASNSLSYSRFGFIISKKVAPLAVDRNRSKRLLRSCVEDLFLEFKPGHDCLFIIRKNLSDMKKEDVRKELMQVLAKEFRTHNSGLITQD